MGYFEDNADMFVQYDTDRMVEEGKGVAEERGTTMDIFHDLYLGVGDASKLIGEATGSQVMLDISNAIGASEFAKPDISQQYGQGRVGRIVDGIARSAPVSLAIGGTTLAGGALGGVPGAIAGYGTAMGIFAKGTNKINLDDIKANYPDMDPQKQKDVAMALTGWEVLSEVGGQVIPVGIGAAVTKGLTKSATKNLGKAMIAEGLLTPTTALNHVIKQVGPKEIVKGLVGGDMAGGLSEVVNEIGQSYTRESAGMEARQADLIDVYFIGSGMSTVLAGGTMALDTAAKSKVRKQLELDLQSEDSNTRENAVATISSGLSNIDPEIGDKFRITLMPRALEGPVDLGSVVDIHESIIVSPETVIAENSDIPTSSDPMADAQAQDRADAEKLPEIYEETRRLDEGGATGGQGKPYDPNAVRDKRAEKESLAYRKDKEDKRMEALELKEGRESFAKGDPLTATFDDAMALEEASDVPGGVEELRRQRIAGEIKEYNTTLLDVSTDPAAFKIFKQDSKRLQETLDLDDNRSKAIRKGMAKVIEDTNKVAEITDLDELMVLEKGIEKTQLQILAAVDKARGAKGDKKVKVESKVQPVEAKATKVSPETIGKPKDINNLNKEQRAEVKQAMEDSASQKDAIDLVTADFTFEQMEEMNLEMMDGKSLSDAIESTKAKRKKKPVVTTTFEKPEVAPEAPVVPRATYVAPEAKEAIVDPKNPQRVKTETKKTKKGKDAFVGATYDNGTTITESGSKYADRKYIVKIGDKSYRAGTQTLAHKGAIGKVELVPFEDKAKETVQTREATKLTPIEKDQVALLTLKIGKLTDKQRVAWEKAREDKEYTGPQNMDQMVYNQMVSKVRGKTKVEDEGNIGFALNKAVQEHGSGTTIAQVREELVKLEKSIENTTEEAKKSDEGISRATVSVDTLYNEGADVTESMDDVETDDVSIVAPEGGMATVDLDDAGVAAQVGKGAYELKKYNYVSGTKVKGKTKDSIVRSGTADGRYYIESQTVDGKVNVTLMSEGKIVQRNFTEPKEAMDWVKEEDESNAQIEKERAGKKTTVRRRKGAKDTVISKSLGENMITETNWEVSSRLADNDGSAQLAIVNMIDQYAGKIPVGKSDVMERLVVLRDNWLEAEGQLKSMFPTGRAMLEQVAESSDQEAAALAKYLLKRGNTKMLDDVTVRLGFEDSYDSETNTITIRIPTRASTRLHEVVHAMTVQQLIEEGVDGPLTKEIEGLQEEFKKEAMKQGLLTEMDLEMLDGLESSEDFLAVRDQYDFTNEDVAYAMLNPKEFLSQAFSSNTVQGVLGTTKTGKTSLLDKFLQFIMKTLGISSEYKTAMSDVLQLTEKISWVETEGSSGSKSLSVKKKDERVPDTDTVTAVIMAGKSDKATTIKEKLWETTGDIQKLASDLLRPISDIIEERSKKIHGQLMKFESELIQKQKEYSAKTKPFMRWYDKLTKSQQVRYDIALMNSNLKKNQKIIDEIPSSIMVPLREVLDELRSRMEDVGLSNVEKEYYFPRRLQNVKGFMEYSLRNSTAKGPIGQAFKEEKIRLGVKVLTPEQETQVVSNMMQQGYISQLPRPGADKKRSVPFVSEDTYEFYGNSNDALVAHIFEMNEKIGQREFIGGSTRKADVAELTKLGKKINKMPEGAEKKAAITEWDSQAKVLEDLETDLENRLSGLIGMEMQEKSADEQQEVFNLISARMRQKGAHGVVEGMRNIGYIMTMGNFLSALTQLGDIPILLYANRKAGISTNLKAIGTAFRNVWKVMRSEMAGEIGATDAFVDQADFTNQMREFSTATNGTARWVDKAFQLSGLKYTDLIGKEAFMQSSYAKYRKVENKQLFMDKFEPMFGKGTEKVWQDIQLGKKTNGDVMTVLIAELAEWQPISLSQQSKQYLKSANGRIFYMLKTFTLRATSGAIRDGAKTMRKGGKANVAKGAAQIASILMLYAVAGAGPDELKDMLRGKESSFRDNVVDNFIQMGLMSRFSLEKGLRSDSLTKTLLGDQLPPFRYADNMIADIYALFNEDKEFKGKFLQHVPLGGNIAYGRSDAGQATYAKQDRKKILDKVKDNRKNKRGPYSGSLSKEIREYNKKVPKDKKITSSTISRAYSKKD